MNKILLVDDDTLFLNTMADVFSSEDYEVDSSTNGMDALDKLHEKKHELVILDYHMHPINGLELVERIRSRDYDCTIIMITAFGTFELATEALEKEVFTILPKPVKIKQLRSAVKKALQSRMLNQQGHVLEVQRSELEKINHLLRVSRVEFQAVFDSITDPVMILDTNLKIVGVNKATMDNLELKQSEILMKPCNHLFCGGEISTCDDCPASRTLSTKLPTQGRCDCSC